MGAMAGPPIMGDPFFTIVTCGQDVEFTDLLGTTTILMLCTAFNGTQPLTTEVYKDGVLIPGAGFPYVIVGANRDAFGTYSFVLSTERCGSDIAVSRIFRQGQFMEFTLTGSKWYIPRYQSTCTYMIAILGLILLYIPSEIEL